MAVDKFMSNGTQKGFSMIELLVAIGIITVTLTSLLGVINFSLRLMILTKETTLATVMVQEGFEAVRSIRDNDWTKLIDGNHGLTSVAGEWDFLGTENVISGFTRKILIESVSRNPATDDIEETYNSSNNDPDTKKIIAIVSWKGKEIKIATYLTNWK